MISIFIPIRKNSKRVKNKNIHKIKKYKLGLTEIKILQLEKFRNKISKLKKLRIFNHKFEYIISTDLPEVIKFCKKFNWIKIHKRKPSLSGDNSLQKLIDIIPEICSGNYILWTHVTSPYFSSDSYINFLKVFFNKKKQKKIQSAFSANLIGKFVYCKKRGWISHDTRKIKWPKTQDLKPLFSMNSAAIISERKVYINNKDRLSKKPLPILSNLKEGFDVDNNEDFEVVKNEIKISI
ncbi:hypothetical protein [Candidatus Pelagibacter sp. HIMB1746]|uniref:hypothetical protein n=1 Tax=Candidatus Pelagibacter sp. HIMB1746 TaxID=3413370 RepID=UPI003F836240